ncbi:MAG: hypothetical protein H5T71_00450 [Chloroflexi bacterium]|nr:hypothetical protein [Chloroflexota bacterium]
MPTYNALTDTNPDHYALYADQDWVLIKEKSRGTIVVPAYDSASIYHNLGYVPTVFSFADNGAEAVWVYGDTMYSLYKMRVYTDEVVFSNATGASATFKYYIFYDNA